MSTKAIVYSVTSPISALLFAGIASLLVFAPPAQALTWSAPEIVATSTTGTYAAQGFEYIKPSVRIDNMGNSVVTWVDQPVLGKGTIVSKSSSSAGVWSTAMPLDTAATAADALSPLVEVSATGDATAIWLNGSGLWSADRPAGKIWTIPQLLVPGIVTAPKFSMNSNGDALLAFRINNGVSVMQRATGAAWSQATILAAANSTAYDAVLADNGDALVAWESFVLSRGLKASSSLSVSRLPKGGSLWNHAALGSLHPRVNNYVHLLVDATGHAGVVHNNYPDNTVYVASTQASAGQAWSLPTTILPACTTCNPGQFFGGTENDAAGNITAFAQRAYYNLNTGVASYKEVNMKSSLSTNIWTAPASLTGGLGQSAVTFDVGANGAAVGSWVEIDKTGKVLLQGSIRSTASGSWGALATLASIPVTSAPFQTATVIAVDVNAQGKAIVLYELTDYSHSAVDSKVDNTLYAVNLR